MEITVKGLRVLVTAGAGGIGRAMTDVFHKAGARVHICDVVQAAIDDTVKAFPGVTATLADVSRPADVDRLFDELVEAGQAADLQHRGHVGVAGADVAADEGVVALQLGQRRGAHAGAPRW